MKMKYILEEDFQEIFSCDLPWEYLEGKRIFCTGATGFLFRYLIKFLCWMNKQIDLKLSFELSCRNISKQIDPNDLYGTHISWIEDEILKAVDRAHKADIIIHAASPANRKSWKNNPMVELVETNILATKALLNKAYKNRAIMLYVSSGEIYPHQMDMITETHIFNAQESPKSFYGACKLAGELLCEKYRKQYNVFCPIIRPFSIYGPGESLDSDRCFTNLLAQKIHGGPIIVEGIGTQRRSYCYISDFVKGIFYILLKGQNTVYNIGNEENVCSIFELAEKISTFGQSQSVIAPLLDKNGIYEVDAYIPDTTKLRTLGWKPTVDLNQCIKRSLQSYE